MDVTGFGPYIKNGSTKIVVLGTGFSVGDSVALRIRNLATGAETTRSGTVLEVVSGGCIARIGPRVDGKENPEPVDDDLVEVSVTVTNTDTGANDTTTDPGIAE